MTRGDFKTKRYFSPGEFDHLGGYEHVSDAAVVWADRVRHEYGRPLIITSAYREGDTGQHACGNALDLAPTHPDRTHYGELVVAAFRIWCGGFGVYDDGHIHGDVRDTVIGARWVTIEGTEYPWTWDNMEQAVHLSRGGTPLAR